MLARRLLPRLPRDAWVVLGGDTLSAVGSGLTLPFFLVYLSRIRGIDIGIAGLALSMVAIAGFAGNPIGGWLTDRVGANRALSVGLLAAAAGAFLVVLVREPWQAFGVAAVVGFGASVVSPAQDALLAVVVNEDERSRVFAVRNLTLNGGYGLGALLASLIADLASPRSFELLYMVDGLTFLAFIPLLRVLLPHVGKAHVTAIDAAGRKQAASYRAVLRDGTFLRFCALIALLVTVGFAQTLAAFPAWATSAGGIGAGGLSVAFAANTITVVIVQLPILRLLEGTRRTTAIILACLCWATAWGLTLVGGTVGGSGTSHVLWFSVAMIVFAVGESLLAPSQAALANDLAPDHLRGRYNGMYALAWTTGLALGPALAGVALARGSGTFLFGALIAGSGLAAVGAARLARYLPSRVNLVTLQARVVEAPDSRE